ncbi:hypothetical protein AK830_g9586 [Neonectria ditissima]|uniref:Uncharacterized protein n=1 Tax=Neonectria ditissima TaxID=78410 RepID=A0A0N8H5S2_9HYPO|nr:hypothetical protein AK830_g9586 [Neonectria ditissima]
MPFDFKAYDQKCNALTAEELQREWEHYTRLISGAATSTAISGIAVPFTRGDSRSSVQPKLNPCYFLMTTPLFSEGAYAGHIHNRSDAFSVFFLTMSQQGRFSTVHSVDSATAGLQRWMNTEAQEIQDNTPISQPLLDLLDIPKEVIDTLGICVTKSGAHAVHVRRIVDALALPSYPIASANGILYLLPLFETSAITQEKALDIIESQLSIIQFTTRQQTKLNDTIPTIISHLVRTEKEGRF